MKKVLNVLSSISIVCSLFLIVYMINPGVINYDDGWGFFGLLTSTFLPCLVFPLWLIFAFRKTVNDKALKIIMSISIVIYLDALVVFLFAYDLGIDFNMAIPIAAFSIVINLICIIKTNKKT